MEKYKIGDVEMIRLSEIDGRITETILAQSRFILEMNSKLLAAITNPALLVSETQEHPDIKRLLSDLVRETKNGVGDGIDRFLTTADQDK